MSSQIRTLVVGPAWVGDMVMAQSLFKIIKQQSPQTIIDVIAPQWTKALLARMPEVNKTIEMPVGHGRLALGERYQLGKKLRIENYDQAIVLPNSFKSALLPLFAKIPLRTGWRGEARSWVLNDCRVLDKNKYPLMIQRFCALGQNSAVALQEDLPRPKLELSEKLLQENVQQLLARFSLKLDKSVLILCPGAEFGEAKKWPAEHFAAVAQSAISKGMQVWIIGSENDRSDAEKIYLSLSPEFAGECKTFAGETTLDEAIDMMTMASVVVSNDSGLMHIAAALDKPLVVVYGSTTPDFTPPLASRVKSLSLELDCSPCFKRQCPLKHLQCLKELKPEMVNDALLELGFN